MRTLRFLCLPLLLAGLLADQFAQAKRGFFPPLREPHSANERLGLMVKDLQVQALGEAPRRVECHWKGGRWSDFEVYGAVDREADESGTLGRLGGLRHMGMSYLRAVSFGTRGALLNQEEKTILGRMWYRTIIAFKYGLGDHCWQESTAATTTMIPWGE